MRRMKTDPDFPIRELPQGFFDGGEVCIFRHRNYVDKQVIHTVYNYNELSYFDYGWKDRFKDLPFNPIIQNGWRIRPFTLILSVAYGENKYICFKTIYDLYGTKLDYEYEWWAFPLHDVFKLFQDIVPNITVLACLYNIDCSTDGQRNLVQWSVDYIQDNLPEPHIINYERTDFIIETAMKTIHSKLKNIRGDIRKKYFDIPEDMYKRICEEMIERFNKAERTQVPKVDGFKVDYKQNKRYTVVPNCHYQHPRSRRLTYKEFCSKILSDIPFNKLQEYSYYYSSMYIVYLCDFLFGYNQKTHHAKEYL